MGFEKCSVQIDLQLLNRAAWVVLRYLQDIRGTAETALFGDRARVSKVLEFHRIKYEVFVKSILEMD